MNKYVRSPRLLIVDAAIDLLLGSLLLVFPKNLVAFLGIPGAENAFYPAILGAVLFGIGIALLVEHLQGAGGLGLLGAVSINMSGGLVLAGWLLFGHLALPPRGLVILWVLVFFLVGISSFELIAHFWGPRQSH